MLGEVVVTDKAELVNHCRVGWLRQYRLYRVLDLLWISTVYSNSHTDMTLRPMKENAFLIMTWQSTGNTFGNEQFFATPLTLDGPLKIGTFFEFFSRIVLASLRHVNSFMHCLLILCPLCHRLTAKLVAIVLNCHSFFYFWLEHWPGTWLSVTARIFQDLLPTLWLYG